MRTNFFRFFKKFHTHIFTSVQETPPKFVKTRKFSLNKGENCHKGDVSGKYVRRTICGIFFEFLSQRAPRQNPLGAFKLTDRRFFMLSPKFRKKAGKSVQEPIVLKMERRVPYFEAFS